MAIHLPRQRDSFGVPARYMDLKSAGLLYTPPGAWRYDSYDIEGDVATLYEENVDLADYQYNIDGFDAVPLPEGATAITGGNGRWKIQDGKLYFKMPVGDVWEDTGWGNGFTGVAVFLESNFIDGPSYHYCLAVQNSDLYLICASPEAIYSREIFPDAAAFPDAAIWQTVAAAAFSDVLQGVATAYICGLSANGRMRWASVRDVELQPRNLRVDSIGLSDGFQVSGPIYNTNNPAAEKIAYSLMLKKDTGRLMELDSWDDIDLGTSYMTHLGNGWTAISGYATRYAITSGGPYDYTRLYGIKAGNLYSLQRNGSDYYFWTATLIDDSGDWYMVQFIEPDVAVAIRRVNTAGGGSGSGTIDPLGDVIVSGAGAPLDGTYTLVSGTGESRLWRRDSGQNRYEIYFDSGYWVIHSSYDEMGNGEDYMMHFDECRGAGTDPWTAAWETAWEDEWQTPAGNNGTVPTVTGTEV